jgi:hypothetical protein
VTSRQRFRETIRYGSPDRVPLFEEGLREDVLECWYEQGLPRDADLTRIFQIDHRERIPLNLEPLPPLNDYPLSRCDLKDLQQRLDPKDPARLPEDWASRLDTWRTREHVLELLIHRGFFLSMGVHDWASFAPVGELIKDGPDRVHGIMEIHGEFAAQLAERVLREVDVDYVSFSEPIGGNDGPLLSPQL